MFKGFWHIFNFVFKINFIEIQLQTQDTAKASDIPMHMAILATLTAIVATLT